MQAKVPNLVRGNTYPLPCKRIRVSLQWQLEAGQKTDLDTSCVAIDRYGNILMDETVYFGNLENSNRSIHHSGDARQGGIGEIIHCNLDRVSNNVCALYFLVTAATLDKTLKDVKTASVRIIDTASDTPLCQFIPAFGGEHTAMFLMRVTREHQNWTMSIIEDMDHTARDFGTLIPEIKGYSRDLCPGIEINPRERIAIMRKGGVIRVKDFENSTSLTDRTLVFGLAWDVTNGENIDLDASAICLDSSLNLVEIISYKNLCSSNKSIRHGGDERTGDKEGDDEKIFIDLHKIPADVMHVGFVINSYSGQELDDVSLAKCHLFDAQTGDDLAMYKLSNDKSLDKHTGLLMACLYRNADEWNLRIISQAAQGLVAEKLVDDLKHFIRSVPAPAPAFIPEPDIIVNAMPDFLPVNEEEVEVNPFDTTGVPVPQPTTNVPSVPVPFFP